MSRAAKRILPRGAAFPALFRARLASGLDFGARDFAIAVRIQFREPIGLARRAVGLVEDAIAIRVHAREHPRPAFPHGGKRDRALAALDGPRLRLRLSLSLGLGQSDPATG